MEGRRKILIMGAAGRDFHNFNVCFRDNHAYDVVAFTAAQIPNIEGRQYPPSLSGKHYPNGIPIESEQKLSFLIKSYAIDEVVFSYSDVSHEYVMHKACMVNAAGAAFTLLAPQKTMLKSNKPVIAICAVRTGCGKSSVSRRVCEIVKGLGKKPVVIRHPMPYGDLFKQRLQRFTTYDDFRKYDCTIEEIEEKEADVIVWDGGNNDTPFYLPDLYITVADPHRPGHELSYYPGETNLLLAEVIIISKVDTAKPENIRRVRENIQKSNPGATIIEAAMPVTVEDISLIKGKRVLVIEDGPTLTHGGMSFGAGVLAARQYGALEIIDPRPYAVGSIHETYRKYPHMENLLPAMGYGRKQVEELSASINRTPCDTVLIGTPIDLRKIIRIDKPAERVRYGMQETGEPQLEKIIRAKLRNFSIN